MATTPSASAQRDVDYPSGDGKPVAETPTHRDNLLGLIDILRYHFRDDSAIYVSGNMFVYYVRGDKRRHVSPDVFLVRGIVDRDKRRDYFLIWEEAGGPEFVVEFTSRSTRKEDLQTKFQLYRDVLRVREYFLFDPFEEYLEPSLKGFRLVGDQYEPIEPIGNRLPSEVTGLHLERDGWDLRLHDPATGGRVLTRAEEAEARLRQAEEARRVVEQEVEALRRELEALRRRPPEGSDRD